MTRSILTAVLALALAGVAAPSQAQHRSGGGGGGRVGGGAAVAVPRGSVGTRGAVVVGRPFVRSPFFFGPQFSFGFYAGYPYFYPYYYPYGYYGYPYYPGAYAYPGYDA